MIHPPPYKLNTTPYTLGSVPVTIITTGLNYRTYEHPEPLDTSVEIDGQVYLVRFSELTAHESHCLKARFAAVCVSGCSECIYGRTRNENSYSRR